MKHEASSKTIPYIGIILAALMSTMAAPLVRWIGDDASMLAIAFYRMLFASIVWTPFYFLRSGKGEPVTRKQNLLIIVAGLFLGFHFAAWTSSLEHTTVPSATFLILAQPMLAAIAAHFFLSEKLNRWNFLAIALTILGAVLIFGGDVQLKREYLYGDFLALMGAVGSMLYLFVARIVRPDRIGKSSGVALQRYLPPVYWTATVVLFALCVVNGENLGSFTTNTWVSLVAMALLPTVVGHSLYNWALRHLPAFTVNIAIVVEPVGASLLVYFLFNEEPSTGLLFGAPLMIFAVALVLLHPPRSGLDGK